MKQYTVVLLYPDTSNIETHTSTQEAESIDQAILAAQEEAEEDNDSNDISAESMTPVAVFEGDHINYCPL